MTKRRTVFWIFLCIAYSGGAHADDWPARVYATDSAHGSDPTGIEVAGDRVFISTRFSLSALDISDPNAIEFLSSTLTSGSTERMTVSGDHAFLAGYHADLSVHDLSDPVSGLPKVGEYTINGSASMIGVGVDEERVIVSGHGTGMIVLDASVPSTPTVIGEIDHDLGETQYFAGEHIQVVGDLIYLAGHEDDFGAFTIYRDVPGGDPESVGEYISPDGNGHMPRMEINGGVAYAVDTARGIQVFDVSSPASPKLIPQTPPAPVLGTTQPPRLDELNATDIALSGDSLISVEPGKLRIFDLENPAAPAPSGELAFSPASPYIRVMVRAVGTTAYAVDSNALYIVDFSDPGAPVLVNSLPLDGRDIRDVEVVGDTAYLAGGGIAAYDISDPSAPVEVGSDGVSTYRAISVDANRAAAWTFYNQRVHFYDFGADGRTPTFQSELDLDRIYHLQLAGDWLWVKGSGGELKRHRVSDITRPGSDGFRVNLVENIIHFVVDGTTLYGASNEYGLGVYDATNPSSPQLTGSLGGKLVTHFVLEGSMLYGTRWDEDLEATEMVTVDMSDPTNPQVIGSLPLPGSAARILDLTVANGFVFGSRNNSPHPPFVIDVSVPSSPRLVPELLRDDKIWNFGTSGDLIFLTKSYVGLEILDVSLGLPSIGVDRDAGLSWDAPDGVLFPIEGSRDLQDWQPLGSWTGESLDQALELLPGHSAYLRATERD